IAKPASALHADSVKRRCAKTRPAKTNKFLTHWRGRIETTIAASIGASRSRPLGDGGGRRGRGREGSRGPRGTRALLRGGWGPSGRSTSVAAWRGRVPSTPPAPAHAGLPRFPAQLRDPPRARRGRRWH